MLSFEPMTINIQKCAIFYQHSKGNCKIQVVVMLWQLINSTHQMPPYIFQNTGEPGFETGQLQLLKDVTGTFRAGILTALMGATGAGKTTLMDVLFGRKTCGIIETCSIIEGDIRIGGYPKVQDTYVRILST